MYSQNIHIYINVGNEKLTKALQICMRKKKVVEVTMNCMHLLREIYLNEIERRRYLYFDIFD